MNRTALLLVIGLLTIGGFNSWDSGLYASDYIEGDSTTQLTGYATEYTALQGSTPDSLPVMIPAEDQLIEISTSRYLDNLDSLINLWYVKNTSGVLTDYDSLMAETDSVVETLPDSVYIDRLARLSSPVELSYNQYVRRYIEMYTGRRKELVGIMLGLSDYYFPMFEEIFTYYDIPLELEYCAIIESALNPRAVSRVGATGLWQFMYGTGRMYDLTINSYVDERRDPIKSTHSAARFMKDLYEIYGDWILVIAAYNCGPGSVNKAIRRSGGKKNFWDIYYYLPRQTRGHVPAFIAATYTMNYYKEHNLVPVKIDLPIPSDTLMITDELHLLQVSEVLGIPIDLLRDINPQYKRDVIPGHSRPFSLKLPMEYSLQFIDLQDSILAYKDSILFNKEIKTKAPADYTSSTYLPEPPSKNMTKVSYTVKSGDNLGIIAGWYHVKLSDLKYWNNIYGSMIRSGQQLIVYVPKTKAKQYGKIDDMSFAEKQRSIGKTVTSEPVASSVANEPLSNDFIYYTIRSGDTLWEIAQKYSGVSDTDIMQLNNISNAGKIRPGQVIRIKRKS